MVYDISVWHVKTSSTNMSSAFLLWTLSHPDTNYHLSVCPFRTMTQDLPPLCSSTSSFEKYSWKIWEAVEILHHKRLFSPSVISVDSSLGRGQDRTLTACYALFPSSTLSPLSTTTANKSMKYVFVLRRRPTISIDRVNVKGRKARMSRVDFTLLIQQQQVKQCSKTRKMCMWA